MKKRAVVFVIMAVLIASFVCAAIPQPTTTKYEAEGRSEAYIYMTEIYKADYFAEFYVVYEEKATTFDEAVTEKLLYEFISRYKIDHAFSRVEVEDLEAAKTVEGVTRVTKRVIFRQNRGRT